MKIGFLIMGVIILVSLFNTSCDSNQEHKSTTAAVEEVNREQPSTFVNQDSLDIVDSYTRLLKIQATIDSMGPQNYIRDPYNGKGNIDSLWADLSFIYDMGLDQEDSIAIELMYRLMPQFDGEISGMFLTDHRLPNLFERHTRDILRRSIRDSSFSQTICIVLESTLTNGEENIKAFENKYIHSSFFEGLSFEEQQKITEFSKCILTADEW